MVSIPAETQFYFTPNTAFWNIIRERMLLLGGARFLLMQIAHPMVAEAVYDHSYVFKNPIRRLHRTLALTFAICFATKSEADIAIAEIERVHRPAVGKLAEAVGKHEQGASYNPRNPRQALWVYATLIEGAVSTYERLVTPIEDSVKEDFYVESTTFAQLMGVRESYLPANYQGLLDYMDEAITSEEIAISDKARKIAPFITGQSVPLVNLATYPVFRLTIGLLPETIRDQYGYSLAEWEVGLIDKFCGITQKVIPHTPDFLRYVVPYQRAQRIIGKV